MGKNEYAMVFVQKTDAFVCIIIHMFDILFIILKYRSSFISLGILENTSFIQFIIIIISFLRCQHSKCTIKFPCAMANKNEVYNLYTFGFHTHICLL